LGRAVVTGWSAFSVRYRHHAHRVQLLLKNQVTAHGIGSFLAKFVVVIISTGVVSMPGNDENRRFSSNVALEVAYKAINFPLRLGWEIC